MSNLIRLNFYPLNLQNFVFKIWRRKYNNETSEPNLYRYSLPEGNELEKRSDYLISLKPKSDFEEFLCKSNYNNLLTQKYLYLLLKDKTVESLKEDEYLLNSKKFRDTISFKLSDHKEGKQIVWMEPFFLPASQKFGFLVDFEFIKKPEIPFSIEVQRLSLSLDMNFRSNRSFYIDRFNKIKTFLEKFNKILFPLTTNNNDNLQISSEMESLPSKMLQPRSYIFGNAGTDASQFRGIRSFGPLEKVDKPIHFIYLFKESDSFLLADLKNALNGNIPGMVFPGFEKLFQIKISKETEIKVPLFTEQNMLKILETIDALSKENFALIPILIEDKENKESYYFMKYNLLKRNIPLQVITPQLLKKRDQLKWSASNLSLQIFSKLGGKPWKVKPSHEKSLIFGIGQAHEITPSGISKYIAYSICTDSSGIYQKYNVLGESQKENEYLEQLHDKIIKVIGEYIEKGYSHFVLHLPFKIKIKELNSIYKAIEQLTKNQNNAIKFVVLKINSYNKYFGYAFTNSLIPHEGEYIAIKHGHSYLAWFDGLKTDNEIVSKRVARPIHIEFLSSNIQLEDNEREMYLQDVLNLAGANIRTFNSTILPTSTYYCELIADFMQKFEHDINIDDMTMPWFI